MQEALKLPQILEHARQHRRILLFGPTGSGKSSLALRLSERLGGEVVNADASQVFGCWDQITARPSPQDLTRATHRLYGHVDWRSPYSAGAWLRDLRPLLQSEKRLIIVGGTGLFFTALTEGLADIPPTDAGIRASGNALSLTQLVDALDPKSAEKLDLRNRARVQRAWEVLTQTGRGIADWQARTPAPALAPAGALCLSLRAAPEWLNPRLEARFDLMLANGALDEVSRMHGHFDPSLPAFKAIGVPELTAHLRGEISRAEARDRAIIATRRYAKRQRTWQRARMGNWLCIDAETLS